MASLSIRTYSLTLVLTGTVVCCCQAAALEPPAPPPSYSWLVMSEIETAFLFPDGWHHIYSQGKLRRSLTVTKAPPSAGKPPRTKFVLNVVDNLQRSNYRPLSQQITDFIDAMAQRPRHDALARGHVTRGPYRGAFLRYRYRTESGESLAHRAYLADDARDTLLILTFEAPVESWEEDWSRGRFMVEGFWHASN